MNELEQLSALRDGDLQDEALRDRIATDAGLRAKWTALDELVLDLAEFPLDEPPAGLNNKVLAAIPGAATAKASRWRVIAGAVLVLAGTAAASSAITTWVLSDATLGPVDPEPVEEVEPTAEVAPVAPGPANPSVAVPGSPPASPVPESGPVPAPVEPQGVVNLRGGSVPYVPDAVGPDVAPRPAPVLAAPSRFSELPPEHWPDWKGREVFVDSATGERGLLIVGEGLVPYVIIQGETGCEEGGYLVDEVAAGMSKKTRTCLSSIASSSDSGARRASFWLLGDMTGSPDWLPAARAHLEQWPEPALAAQVGAELLRKSDLDFQTYAELAYPYGTTGSSLDVAALELYARWRTGLYLVESSRLSWHEAVDAVDLFSTNDPAKAAEPLLGSLIRSTPMPSGCASVPRAGDDAEHGACLLRVVEDDAYPDAVRVAFASEADRLLVEPEPLLRLAQVWAQVAPSSVEAHVALAERALAAGLVSEAQAAADRVTELDADRGSWAAMTMAGHSVCGDSKVLTPLEPKAMVGTLSAADVATLEDLVETCPGSLPAKASLLLMQNAWSQEGRPGWEDLAVRHLSDIDGEVALRLKLAQHYYRERRDFEAASTARRGLDDLEGTSFAAFSRRGSLYKIQAAALHRLWASGTERYASTPTSAGADEVESLRRRTEIAVQEWLRFDEKSEEDAAKALKLCLKVATDPSDCD